MLKLLVCPVVIWALAKYVVPVNDEMLIGILTVIAAMPAAGTGVALNILYGTHEKESSILVFISTVVSVATIPLITILLLA